MKKIIINISISILILFLSGWSLLSCKSASVNKETKVTVASVLLPEDTSVSMDKINVDEKPLSYPPEVVALAIAYNPAVSGIFYSNGEPAVAAGGKKFLWAEGKLLPEEKLKDKEKYRSYGFYPYREEMPPVPSVGDEKALEMIKRYTNARENLPRDNSFLATLYHGFSLKEILPHIKEIFFMGFDLEVHEDILPALKAVEGEVKRAIEKGDTKLKDFIASLEGLSAFNWRRIEDSNSRSFHSYGIAIDFLAKDYRKKPVYWNWTRVYDDNWYTTPHSKRWMPPKSMIKIFEDYGFIWGGKWFFYDNMHFEYRPELLLLSGRTIKKP